MCCSFVGLGFCVFSWTEEEEEAHTSISSPLLSLECGRNPSLTPLLATPTLGITLHNTLVLLLSVSLLGRVNHEISRCLRKTRPVCHLFWPTEGVLVNHTVTALVLTHQCGVKFRPTLKCGQKTRFPALETKYQ